MPISEKWIAAEAAAGPRPAATSRVAEVTPYPMPSEPSTSWAARPTRASSTSLRIASPRVEINSSNFIVNSRSTRMSTASGPPAVRDRRLAEVTDRYVPWKLPTEYRNARRWGREPLQEQHPRHRVQPLRGASAATRSWAPARSPRSTARPPARSWPRSTGWPARTSPRRSSTPTATRRSSTRRPTPRRCRSRSRRATAPGWTPSTGASAPWPSSAAPRPRPASTGRSASWCSAPTRPIWMYGAGPTFAGVIHRNGNERDQQDRPARSSTRAGAPRWC